MADTLCGYMSFLLLGKRISFLLLGKRISGHKTRGKLKGCEISTVVKLDYEGKLTSFHQFELETSHKGLQKNRVACEQLEARLVMAQLGLTGSTHLVIEPA